MFINIVYSYDPYDAPQIRALINTTTITLIKRVRGTYIMFECCDGVDKWVRFEATVLRDMQYEEWAKLLCKT